MDIISPELVYYLEKLATERIPPQLLLACYKDLLPATKDDNDQVSQSVATDEVQYSCPWCGTSLKLAKDFIRHAKQKCYAVEEYRCPDCSKSYARKERFTRHHKKVHRHRCKGPTNQFGSGPCVHASKAHVTLPPKQTLGCGFCHELFQWDLHGFLRHLIHHYREDTTLAHWTTGPHVPCTKLLMHSQASEGTTNNTANWGPYALQQVSHPPGIFRTDLAPLDSHDTTDYHAGDPDMQINNEIDPGMSLPNRHPTGSSFGVGWTALTEDVYRSEDQKFLQGVGGHLVDDAYALLDTDPCCRTQDKQTKTANCAQLVAEVEHANSFQHEEWMLPFNPTESLPRASHRKKSLSDHLFQALQSLPQW